MAQISYSDALTTLSSMFGDVDHAVIKMVLDSNRGHMERTVGNIPFDATESDLTSIFSRFGRVKSFQIEKDGSGQPKGFGFCEFFDRKHAPEAVRALNNHEYNGRTLTVDLAAPEKFSVETSKKDGGKASSSSSSSSSSKKAKGDKKSKESVANSVLEIVQKLSEKERVEILSHMKKVILNNPEGAKTLLTQNPQLGQALLGIQAMFGLVTAEDIGALQRGDDGPPPGAVPIAQAPGVAQSQAQGQPPQTPLVAQQASAPANAPAPATQETGSFLPPNIREIAKTLPPQQRAVLEDVLKLTNEEFARLPAEVQQQITDLRNQIMASHAASTASHAAQLQQQAPLQQAHMPVATMPQGGQFPGHGATLVAPPGAQFTPPAGGLPMQAPQPMIQGQFPQALGPGGVPLTPQQIQIMQQQQQQAQLQMRR